MYADFEAILEPIQANNPNPENRTLKKSINTFPLVFAFIVSSLMGKFH